MERRKYLGRYDNDCIKSIDSRIIRIDDADIFGYVALVQIQEVNYPRMVGNKESEICIADNGYSELIFLPDNENWQLCAIYDSNDDIVEWYFDVTRKNAIDENGNPYCDDLYLDAALMPDGRVLVFDEDELVNAFKNGKINQQEYNMAQGIIKKLIDKKIIDVAYMKMFCSGLRLLFAQPNL